MQARSDGSFATDGLSLGSSRQRFATATSTAMAVSRRADKAIAAARLIWSLLTYRRVTSAE